MKLETPTIPKNILKTQKRLKNNAKKCCFEMQNVDDERNSIIGRFKTDWKI